MNTFQRELKFRAFDNRPDSAYFGQMVENPDIAECIRLGIPVMQYTGLKDKNGKEIYEGDVLRVSDGGQYQPKPGPVVFEPGFTCGIRHQNGEWGGAITTWMNHLPEVIGNIYENPELLAS